MERLEGGEGLQTDGLAERGGRLREERGDAVVAGTEGDEGGEARQGGEVGKEVVVDIDGAQRGEIGRGDEVSEVAQAKGREVEVDDGVERTRCGALQEDVLVEAAEEHVAGGAGLRRFYGCAIEYF